MLWFSEHRTSRVAVLNSPFPGMDPYLERHWGDVHQALVTYIRDQLQPSLPETVRMPRMQERVYIESPGMRHESYPDVRVVERPRRRAARAGTAVAERVATGRTADGVLTPAEPIVIRIWIPSRSSRAPSRSST